MSEQDLDPHAMVGAYVIDALNEDQRVSFERHLAGCESCQREVGEFAETLGELSWMTETPPPPSLRSSVLAEIATVRPLPPESGPTEQAVSGPADLVATALPIDELARRRQRRVRRLLTGLVAAALVSVVALGGWVAVLVGDQRAQQVAEGQVAQLLTAPDAKVYATTLNGARVSYVVSRQRNQAVFVGDQVPSPGADKVFQLWTLHGEVATSQGLMPDGAGTHWFTGSLDQAQAVAVTIEPEGGSATPTTTPLAVVTL